MLLEKLQVSAVYEKREKTSPENETVDQFKIVKKTRFN